MRKGDRSYGWVVVGVSFLLLIGAFGTQLSFGLFLKPLAAEFGWSRAAVSGGMSLLMAVSGLMAVVMGKITDRYGSRAAIAPGVVVGAACYALLSRMHSLWEFYVLFGVGGGLLAGCGYTPTVTAVSHWFEPRRRTLALGLALLGIIAGQMLLSPVVSAVIEDSGWRAAWVVLAGVAFVSGLPAIALTRAPEPKGGGRAASGGVGPAPAAGTRGLTTREACGTSAFWILMMAGATLGMGYYAFAAHIVSYASDVGVAMGDAALIFTVSSAGGIAGTLLAGALASRLGHRWALLGLTGVNAAVMFLFIAAGSTWSFYLLGAILGFAFAAVIPVRMAVMPPLFGVRSLGTILGMAALSFSAGAIAGPFVAGYVFDTTSGYGLAFLLFGILVSAGATGLYFLRVPRRMATADPAPIWRAEDGLG